MFSDDVIDADVVTVVGDISSVFSAAASIVVGATVADTSSVGTRGCVSHHVSLTVAAVSIFLGSSEPARGKGAVAAAAAKT